MKRLFPITLLLILLSVLSTNTVFACSGGGPLTIERFIERADTVVMGQFIELDDANANGIFQVHSYLMGDGEAEYITVSRNDIRRPIARDAGRYYSCGGQNIRHISAEGTYILSLTRNMDGSYHAGWHNFYFYYPNSESVIKAHTSDIFGSEAPDLNLQDTIVKFSEIIGQEPRLPTPDLPYPRTTPIILTSESGQQYLLPVDSPEIVPLSEDEAFMMRRDQHECQPAPCTVFSPNGLDTIYLVGENDPRQEQDWLSINQIHNMEGQRVSIAANSEALVLWQNGELQVYIFWNENYGYPDDPMGMLSQPALVNSISVHPSSLDYPAVWSPDGRTLAFSDEQGLWLWDVFTENYPPQLLIPTTTDVPIARYFSPEGRYVRFYHFEQKKVQ